MSATFGTWFTYQEPKWVDNIDYAPESVIRKSGMSRQEIKDLLWHLKEHEIIE